MDCGEAIINPICPFCLEKEIEVWLNKKSQKELIISIKNKTNNLFKAVKNENNLKCILCSKELDTCPYCYTEFIYELLKKIKPELVEEFITYFNYDLEHTGYDKIES